MDETSSQNDADALSANLGSEKARAGFELRTPVNHVLSICDLLLEEKDIPELTRSDLSKIHQSARRLINLIGEFLDHGDALGDAELKRLRHDLRTPVNHIIGYSEMLAEQADEDGQEQLRTDLERIGEAGKNWLPLMEQRLAEFKGDEGRPESAAEASIPDLAAARPITPPARTRVSATGKILIVDDDEWNRDVLTRRLQQYGHEIEAAIDGESALKLLAGQSFDLVLLDMIMPGLNGVDVLTRMKSDDHLRMIPVIVISALEDDAGIARCLELGAEDYLAKPFNPVVLRARIDTTLEKKRLREAERRYLAKIEEEQEKSERLLLNVLPEPIAARLKAGEEAIADRFHDVTVLFTDLVGFTQLSAESDPEEVVGMLNRIFSSFDVLAQKHGLEKIKTIGDAYMAVGGLPVAREDHAEAVGRFAIDIMKSINRFNAEESTEVALRIGIDSGPVVAGIIGRDKFIYDLWGDTVNTASRMESLGEPGRIQVSAAVYEKLREHLSLTPRGEIPVKGKGTMRTWFLDWEE